MKRMRFWLAVTTLALVSLTNVRAGEIVYSFPEWNKCNIVLESDDNQPWVAKINEINSPDIYAGETTMRGKVITSSNAILSFDYQYYWYGWLDVYVDDVLVRTIEPEQGKKRTVYAYGIPLKAGSHNIRFTFRKEQSGNAGHACIFELGIMSEHEWEQRSHFDNLEWRMSGRVILLEKDTLDLTGLISYPRSKYNNSVDRHPFVNKILRKDLRPFYIKLPSAALDYYVKASVNSDWINDVDVYGKSIGDQATEVFHDTLIYVNPQLNSSYGYCQTSIYWGKIEKISSNLPDPLNDNVNVADLWIQGYGIAKYEGEDVSKKIAVVSDNDERVGKTIGGFVYLPESGQMYIPIIYYGTPSLYAFWESSEEGKNEFKNCFYTGIVGRSLSRHALLYANELIPRHTLCELLTQLHGLHGNDIQRFNLVYSTATDESNASIYFYDTLTVCDMRATGCIRMQTEKIELPMNEYSSVQLKATGKSPITWKIVEGHLPAGLTLGVDGVISGTPVETGVNILTVEASNALGTTRQFLNIIINFNYNSSPKIIMKPDGCGWTPSIGLWNPSTNWMEIYVQPGTGSMGGEVLCFTDPTGQRVVNKQKYVSAGYLFGVDNLGEYFMETRPYEYFQDHIYPKFIVDGEMIRNKGNNSFDFIAPQYEPSGTLRCYIWNPRDESRILTAHPVKGVTLRYVKLDDELKTCVVLKSNAVEIDANFSGTIVLPSEVDGYRVIGETPNFANISNKIEVVIPDCYTSLSLFTGSSVTSVTIPSSIKTIPDFCFWNCKSLTELVIPEGVEVISSSAIGIFCSFKKLTIPSTLKVFSDNIETHDYENFGPSVNTLEDVYCYVKNPLDLLYRGAIHCKNLYVPKGTAEDYRKANFGGNIIEMNTEPIVKFEVKAEVQPKDGGVIEGSGIYNEQSAAVLVAKPAEGYAFIGWTEDGVDYDLYHDIITLNVEKNHNLVARFAKLGKTIDNTVNDSVQVSVIAIPVEGGKASGGGQVPRGSQVTVTATPAYDYLFDSWRSQGKVVSKSTAYTFAATSDVLLTASFIRKPDDVFIEDYTYRIINPQFDDYMTAWVGLPGPECIAGKADNPNAEGWNSNFDVYQIIDGIPNGVYRLKAQAFYRTGSNSNAWNEYQKGTAQVKAWLYANDKSIAVKNIMSEVENTQFAGSVKVGQNSTGSSLYVPNNQESASEAFAKGHYENQLDVMVSDNTLRLGIRSTGSTYDRWTCYDNFRLYFMPTDIILCEVKATAGPTVCGIVTGGGTYIEGQTATLTATSAEGYKFVNWQQDGKVISTANPYVFTVTNNASVMAVFEAVKSYKITATASPSDGGTVTGAGTYVENEQVTLTATPSEEYEFVRWQQNGKVLSTANPYVFIAKNNASIVAIFEKDDPVTITAKNITVEYGEPIPELEYTTSGSALRGSNPTLSCDAVQGSPVGTYTITVDASGVKNSEVKINNGKLTIKRAQLIVGVEDVTIHQGDPIPELTITYDGFKMDDTPETALSELPTAKTTAKKDSPVGTYIIYTTGGAADNYTLKRKDGTLTVIEPRDIVTITAKNVSVEYGEPIPELEYTTSGSALRGGKPLLNCDAVQGSPVGTYSITVDASGVENSEVNVNNGKLTIKRARLTVGVEDVTIYYGDPIPELIITYDGLKMDETPETAFSVLPTAKTTAREGSSVGTYIIYTTGGTAPNYSLKRTDGTLTIEYADGVDGISENQNAERWCTLDGRVLSRKPIHPGIYLRNGVKVVIRSGGKF